MVKPSFPLDESIFTFIDGLSRFCQGVWYKMRLSNNNLTAAGGTDGRGGRGVDKIFPVPGHYQYWPVCDTEKTIQGEIRIMTTGNWSHSDFKLPIKMWFLTGSVTASRPSSACSAVRKLVKPGFIYEQNSCDNPVRTGLSASASDGKRKITKYASWTGWWQRWEQAMQGGLLVTVTSGSDKRLSTYNTITWSSYWDDSNNHSTLTACNTVNLTLEARSYADWST